MRNFVQPGGTLTVTAPASIVSGQLVVVGSLLGVAAYDAASGDSLEIATEGVFELPKLSTDNVAIGDPLYWDSANAYLVKTAGTGSKKLAGIAAAAAAASTTLVRVKLNVPVQTGPA